MMLKRSLLPLKVSQLYDFGEVIQRVADFHVHADATKNGLKNEKQSLLF